MESEHMGLSWSSILAQSCLSWIFSIPCTFHRSDSRFYMFFHLHFCGRWWTETTADPLSFVVWVTVLSEFENQRRTNAKMWWGENCLVCLNLEPQQYAGLCYVRVYINWNEVVVVIVKLCGCSVCLQHWRQKAWGAASAALTHRLWDCDICDHDFVWHSCLWAEALVIAPLVSFGLWLWNICF